MKKIIFFFLFIFFLVYFIGFFSGIYRIFPYNIIANTYNFFQTNKTNKFYFNIEFNDKLIPSEKIYEPIISFKSLKKYNDNILVKSKNFSKAYANIKIENINILSLDNNKTKILKLNFKYNNKKYNSYAYIINKNKNDLICNKNENSTLILPGSGMNQSYAIFNEIKSNYHYGILDSFSKINNIFIFIKPNQGVLAWHDNKNKISMNYIYSHHLINKGSYSLSYLIQSIAISKFLNNCYNKKIVAGLSQGGLAAFINAIQSNSDLAIIASGYSLLLGEFYYAAPNQIVDPSGFLLQLFDKSKVKKILNSSKTKYIFTYGLKDHSYYPEAKEKFTCNFFSTLKNVECIFHQGGHEFPYIDITKKIND